MARQTIIFINSHPIQYFVPLYQYLAGKNVDVECWYCSDETVKGHFDRQFGTKVQWDIPLLEGYTYRFFRNRSWKPSLYNGFFGLINPGLLRALWRKEKSTIVVHGWNYFTHVFALIVGKLSGHTVCIRGESPLNQELMKSKFNRFVKKIFLQRLMFPIVDRFLYIGKQNRKFYEYYGVRSDKLVFTPYSVDNTRFQQAVLSIDKKAMRAQLGIPPDAFVILFAAKFIEKKRPLDLLEAYRTTRIDKKFLVMVGEGELRPGMEKYIRDHGLTNVMLPGFINQTDIVRYYGIADVFVLCSGVGETWGLSVNEAMNFDVPAVVSDIAGCAEDLVADGAGGFSFTAGSPAALALALEKCKDERAHLQPRTVIDGYSYEQIFDGLERFWKA